jgi:hypothetical protein
MSTAFATVIIAGADVRRTLPPLAEQMTEGFEFLGGPDRCIGQHQVEGVQRQFGQEALGFVLTTTLRTGSGSSRAGLRRQ